RHHGSGMAVAALVPRTPRHQPGRSGRTFGVDWIDRPRHERGAGAMGITAMNHFTVLTHDLDATVKFYGMFGLNPGWRPPFGFPGAWLYSGDTAILHVIKKDTLTEKDGVLDHMAFSAVDLPAVAARLTAA